MLSQSLEIWDGLYSGLYRRWSRKARRTIWDETINNSELETQVNEWWRKRIHRRRRQEYARELRLSGQTANGVKRKREEELRRRESKTREKVDLGRIWCSEKHKWVQPDNV